MNDFGIKKKERTTFRNSDSYNIRSVYVEYTTDFVETEISSVQENDSNNEKQKKNNHNK